ncbi:MAG TPA: BTAD domain-containing putative transcriptional regulator [Actinoplanes sp.]
MTLAVHLLGRPRLTRPTGDGYRFRSRKSWAVLAYLLLSDRPPTRSRLAALLFADADDPGRALRWSLAEIRRGLGTGGSLDGDPLVLHLPPDTVVDADVIAKGDWADAVGLPGFGSDLLEGMAFRSAAAFDTWLLSRQRHVAAASEAILHEAALVSTARGALDAAVGYAARAAELSPLDENHQALLIRLYRLTGDDAAAVRQFAACTRSFWQELGVAPGPAVEAAMRETRHRSVDVVDTATIEAIIESGSAAVGAGALATGAESLRTAVRLADAAGTTGLRVTARLVLAEALIHSLGGLDEEGLASLYAADDIAADAGLGAAVAQARAELGYVDFLRGRYDRAELRLTDALRLADDAPVIAAKAKTYLGSVHSDRAEYDRASTLLADAVELSWVAGVPAGRPTGWRCWVASPYCGTSRTMRRTCSTRRSPWPNGSSGWHSCRGRSRSAARSNWLVVTWPGPPSCSSRRSPARAGSGTRAGRACRRGAWRWWPRPPATPNGRSRCWRTPGYARTGSPTRTPGSTRTSSTPGASSACGTDTRRPGDGSPCSASGRPAPGCAAWWSGPCCTARHSATNTTRRRPPC